VLNEEVWKRLRDLGVDMKQLIECLDELCPEVPKEHIPTLKRQITQAVKTTKAVRLQVVADVRSPKR